MCDIDVRFCVRDTFLHKYILVVISEHKFGSSMDAPLCSRRFREKFFLIRSNCSPAGASCSLGSITSEYSHDCYKSDRTKKYDYEGSMEPLLLLPLDVGCNIYLLTDC